MRYNLFMAFLFLAGCSAGIIFNSKGEVLYYNKCGGCHRLYSKSEFTGEKWRSEIQKMSKKAKLSDDEKRMLIEYFTDDRKN